MLHYAYMLETLENLHWKLHIVPTLGASTYRLYARLKGRWEAVMRESPEETLAGKHASPLANFFLIPFSNRIKDAAFDFQGRHYQLKAGSNDGSTQHGDVRDRRWRRGHQSKNMLEYELDTTSFTDFNFPFPFEATVRYALEDTSLVIQLSLRNEGLAAMPAGFGIHPYFRRHIGSSSDIMLQFVAEGLYEVDKGLIPTGIVKPPLDQDDFSTARAVGKQHLNHLYRDWSKLSLHWPGVARLGIKADSVFKHLVVFTHEDGSLAIEPVTNATDGFNLLARGFEGHGVVVLEPGETLEGTITMTLLEA